MIFHVFIFFIGCFVGFYFLLLLFFRRGFQNLKPSSSSESPKVSIIVPAHNEENHLPLLLKALQKQTYPRKQLEMILIDDRSTDRTLNLMQSFAKTVPNCKIISLKEISGNTAPKKRAIEKGIAEAGGDIILTTDADSIPQKSWVESMIDYYDEETVMVLGYAPYLIRAPLNSLFHKILALDYFAMGAVAAASAGMGHPSTSNGANFSYRQSAFQKAGGFGETTRWISGDDDLLMHRIHKENMGEIKFAFNKKAAVYNWPPENFKHFFYQRVRFSSKHLAYPPKMIAALSLVYGIHALLGLLFLISWTSIQALTVFLILISLKSAGEILFLLPAQKQMEERNLLKYFPLAAIPYLFYVTVFPILGQILKPRWSHKA